MTSSYYRNTSRTSGPTTTTYPIGTFIDDYTYVDVRTIWGFYNGKKGEYYAPINAKKAGSVVDIKQTRNYTAMQLNLKGLEVFF